MQCPLFRLLDSAMGSMALLPQEFGGAQEERRALLPAHHVVPLVDKKRQIAIALYPFGKAIADDGFAGRANSQRFFQFLAAAARDPGQFRRKAFNVFRLLLQEAAGNEQGEVGVEYSRFFKARIQADAGCSPRWHSRRVE